MYCQTTTLGFHIDRQNRGKIIAKTDRQDTDCVTNLRAKSHQLRSSAQAVVVYSTCGAGGSGSSLQINRKADPIASWAVVANVEPIVGIRCSKSLEKTNKQNLSSKFRKRN
jgi:hypothetical protein